jgi:hypothetical protein
MTVSEGLFIRILNACCNATEIEPIRMSWSEQDAERRIDHRYNISLDLRWELVHRRKVIASGTGRTLDLSRGGILFDAGQRLPVDLAIELTIAWPTLHNLRKMRLLVSGRIVRTSGTQVAIRMSQHEFRTVGTSRD